MSTLLHRTCAAAAAVTGIATAAFVGAGAAAAAPSAADAAFITANAQTNIAEMTIGALALDKAQTSQARDLATMTVADHKAAMAKLTAVAQALGVALPTAPNAEQQAQAATLKATVTTGFDLAYSEIQVAGHQKSIAGTDTEIATGADPTVVAYANYYLPVATSHLTMAQAAVTDLGGTPVDVPAGTGGQGATTSALTEGLEIGLLAIGGVVVVGATVALARRRRHSAY